MLIKKPNNIIASEITSESVYKQRRRILRGGAALALGISTNSILGPNTLASTSLPHSKSTIYTVDEELTEREAVISYNNFYEFSTNKKEPAKLAENFRARPWTVEVSGACHRPKTWDIDDILKLAPLEERIYRFRCVEAWSMVIPWLGFSLASLIKVSEPTGNAKFVEFETLVDESQFPNQQTGLLSRNVLSWPYREGLRLDEAGHPLTLLTLGLYGEILPNQNGAPIRLVIPWKYGFKSIKSVVRINFTEKQPLNTWQQQAPSEYGFYANVNPLVDHPRWTQAMERRVGDWFKRATLPFNGYEEQVAGLYAGMDLRKFY